eukprot:1153285-Pelagomonas_calceolata.AAC.2
MTGRGINHMTVTCPLCRAGPVHPYANAIQTLLTAYNPAQSAPSSASAPGTAASDNTALPAVLLRAPVFPPPPEDAPLRLVKTRRQLQVMVQQLWQVGRVAELSSRGVEVCRGPKQVQLVKKRASANGAKYYVAASF